MSMTSILLLETSTRVCSVGLSIDNRLVSIRETSESQSHSELITSFIEEVVSEPGLAFTDLSAVAVSMGPGSYTGLRIGVSTAKGICYALDIPLIAIDTLKAMAFGMLQKADPKLRHNSFFCPMIDARRMEVYTQVFDIKLNAVTGVEAKILDSSSFMEFLDTRRIMFFGNGSSKAKSVLTHSNALFYDDFKPSARFMIPIAWNYYLNAKFEDVAYFEPLYLKDFIATVPKNKTSGNP